MRREWIEMLMLVNPFAGAFKSPFVRREWIEIFPAFSAYQPQDVSLREKGVD